MVILRTSRFFPEPDDRDDVRRLRRREPKVNELLYRRVDLEDVVSAHRLRARARRAIGFGRYIISATTPFMPDDLVALHTDAPPVVARHVARYEAAYERLGWRMFDTIERVYVNAAARRDLGWAPQYDFAYALERLAAGEEWRSELALAVGAKGYHAELDRGLHRALRGSRATRLVLLRRDDRLQRGDAVGVEGAARLLVEQCQRPLGRPRLAVDAVGGQRVVDVGDGEDAHLEVELAGLARFG